MLISRVIHLLFVNGAVLVTPPLLAGIPKQDARRRMSLQLQGPLTFGLGAGYPLVV